MRKKILITGAAVLAAAVLGTALVLLLPGKEEKVGGPVPEIPPKALPAWSDYIAEHTVGTVSRYSKIRIRFTRDMLTEEQLKADWSHLLSVTPEIEGKIRFVSLREAVMEPDSPLDPGTQFHVTLDSRALEPIPEELGGYQFFFVVIRQNFEVEINEPLTIESVDPTAELSGVVRTADRAERDKLEEMIRVDHEGVPKPPAWAHSEDGLIHSFTVKGIQRSKKRSDIVVSWSGKSIGVDEEGSKKIEVPPFGEFKVTGSQLKQDGGVSIRVGFSAPLDPKQDLTGLVRLDNADVRATADGNFIIVYVDSPVVGEKELVVSPGVRSIHGDELGKEYTTSVTIKRQTPQVRFSGPGTILPAGIRQEVLIEAINVKSVHVTAFKIYPGNIGQFLQVNGMNGSTQLGRVGRHLWRKTIQFSGAQQDLWKRYSLDLTRLVKKHPGAMLRLTLAINRGNSIYPCSAAENAVPVPALPPLKDTDFGSGNEYSSWDFAEEYFSGSNIYSWRDRNDPCKEGYYRFGTKWKHARNFLGSNIGILAKRGNDGSLLVLTTDIRSGKPLADSRVEVKTYQNQLVARATTSQEGLATMRIKMIPYYIVAKNQNQTGYLKIIPGSALSTSHFEVGGQAIQGGVKGFLYGDRDIWRPGDKIYLTLVLHDPDNNIPDNHPATLHLINPKGQIASTSTNRKPMDGFYAFTLATAREAQTGNWTVKALVGDRVFNRKVKIEAIIPNRLRAELSIGDGQAIAAGEEIAFNLKAAWLHGAKASHLKGDVTARLSPKATQFRRFKDYQFDDPARHFRSKELKVWEGKLDGEGVRDFEHEFTVSGSPAGQMNANFVTRIFEPGGAFSSMRSRQIFNPYRNYVGVRMPKGDAKRDMLLTDTPQTVRIVTLDTDGKPVSLDSVELSLFKIEWKWWWDKSSENLSRYSSSSYRSRVAEGKISTKKGRGSWNFQINYPQWGRYLLRACDTSGGHCSGKVFYIDWPGWAGKSREEGGGEANVLSLTANKKKYRVGETAVLELPEGATGRALLTLENGSRVLSYRWLNFRGARRPQIKVPIKKSMAPNVYVSVTLLQPHSNRGNDRPIRLYGIVPLQIEDPGTRIAPQLRTAKTWKPRSSQNVTVKEKKGRPMTYTLAVVDEGLLGITNFKTPDLHREFYRRESLGVLTWDVFDQVVGAYGAELERLLAIGGGEGGGKESLKPNEERFPPVVRFYGPFRLKARAQRKHKVDLPQYIGSVRVMVVAGRKGAYGSVFRNVRVFEPVSLLATLPRVLGPGEELEVPVSLFIYDPTVEKVALSLKVSPELQAAGPLFQEVVVKNEQEKLVRFRLRVGKKPGSARITVNAESGKHKSRADTFLQIRLPNLPEARSVTQEIKPGADWNHTLKLHGVEGTNRTVLTVSAVPPFGLDYRLGNLVRYPYGCVEQVISAAFPQVYLPKLVKMSPKNLELAEANVHEAIGKMRSFQTASGGFSYWPGQRTSQYWADTYAGHFLVEARRAGYRVPDEILAPWIGHASKNASGWIASATDDATVQAYRLYVLTLADRPDIGSMNRLREHKNLHKAGRWLLAAAYAKIGKQEPALALLGGAQAVEYGYSIPGITFGSKLRDQGILLQALTLTGQAEPAKALANEIAGELASDRWFSTQSLGFSMTALSRYILGEKGDRSVKFDFTPPGGSAQSVSTKQLMVSLPISGPKEGDKLQLRNTSSRTLYGTVTVTGIPLPEKEREKGGKLEVEVKYIDADNDSVDPQELKQGADVKAEVTVSNRSGRDLENLALRHVLPSGWEIAHGQAEPSGENVFVYRDIRDDRVNTHFALKDGQSRTFALKFTATYAGRFYAPGIVLEDMYDAALTARTGGQWVKVVKP